MVSILGNYHYSFPKKQKLKKKLKDMLEDDVDEKYYLSEKALNGIVNTTFAQGKIENRMEKNGIIPTLEARDYKDPNLTYEVKLAHGWNKGSVKQKDVISTIDRGVDNWHTLIGEVGGGCYQKQ